MRVRDSWYIVTAGHVLEEIDNERREGSELGSFRIWDGWSPNAQYRDPFPFTFDGAPQYRVDREGLDYGLIRLCPNHVSLLNANNVVPVGEEHYEKKWPDVFHGYAMIGVPGATVDLQRHRGTSTEARQSTCVLNLAEEPDPPTELVKPFPRFYARILEPEDSPLWREIGQDIAGMSGGPVIGIRRDGEELNYWIIGIQSGWFKPRRVIAACYFQDFARIVAETIDRAQAR
jgi:hypothetical protein